MQNPDTLKIEKPSLPGGGGTLNGMGESLGATGPDGTASLTLPLPVSAGRGVAPGVSLSYSSAAGNGAFAMGWQCEPGFISVQTAKGVPRYNDSDTFLGPDGEVLVPGGNEQGHQIQRTASVLLGTALAQPHRVTRWQPRTLSGPVRLEFWQPQSGEDKPFWLLFAPDGQIHLFGKHEHARVADPQNTSRVARWLMEETVTPTGEHIYYYWRPEDDIGCDDNERSGHPVSTAQRYLYRISYGNIQPETSLMAIARGIPAEDTWLFHLVFDYGERDPSLQVVPGYHTSQSWRCRPDCFSRYDYGFEIRTRRLCRQVLMFHRLQTLAGHDTPDEAPALVSRLILDYALNSRVSLLLSACNVAHEDDGKPVMLPPLELEYQRVAPGGMTWQDSPELGKFNTSQPWQLVDLYGEGLPGILYQEPAGAWWYQTPVRDTTAVSSDAVTYGPPEPLPAIPAQREGAMLMDINGDGHLDWVVTHSGLQGYHSIKADQAWTSFIPLESIPLEYFHPAAMLADMSGAGLPDLAMIGPKSVRFWQNNRQGWGEAQNVVQDDAYPLPIYGYDARVLVGFSDMTGSGRAHLVRIADDNVIYWPNLGHGKFGQPVTIPGFILADSTFNPDRIYLADIDGSGTTDLIYAHGDHLALYINESGNRFAEPLRLPLPKGVNFDDTCRLQIADIQGLGIGSLILTVPHKTVRHFRLDLMTQKPWLLNEINNNMGANTTLLYRSSAQFWLDEKSQAAKAGRVLTSYLPFPVHLLWRTSVLDEITGNRLSGKTEYAHGVWDGHEREYRGFARVIQTDMDELADGSRSTDLPATAPMRSVSWFATGSHDVDKQLPEEFWSGDDQAFPSLLPRFTRYDTEKRCDVAIIPDAQQAYWLNRALKGALLRQEFYGADGTEKADIPYAVREYRPQVRALPGLDVDRQAALVLTGESRNWSYERTSVDPQCSQTLLLITDALGYPLAVLNVAYPRREQPAISPCPDSLPDTLFASSYDEQQKVLRLELTRTSFHHLENDDIWFLGLPISRRADARILSRENQPQQGISLEWVADDGAALLPGREQDYLGHESVNYIMQGDSLAYPPRIAYTETAEYDQAALSAFDGVLDGEELEQELKNAGWVTVQVPFQNNSDARVWAGRQGYTDFAGPEGFFRPLAQRETLLTGKKMIGWDTHYCVVIREESPSGLKVEASYDYRFLTPIRILDANDNTTAITYDALGRVCSIRFWGTEEGRMCGYTPPEDEATPFLVPNNINDALEISAGIPVAGFVIYASHSWMPLLPASLTAPPLTGTHIGRLALKRYLRQHPDSHIATSSLLPPHTLTVSTDRYDSDPEQQLLQRFNFSDGFGRPLQTSIRHEAGEAWQLNEADAAIAADASGQPASQYTDFRWAISGRTEFDAKGRARRTYLPYFLNNWRYVNDDSARQDLFADTTFYDALGRETSVLTAKGWLRRTLFTPWFVVNEDENDTAAEILEKQ